VPKKPAVDDKSRTFEPGTNKTYGLGVRDLERSHLISTNEQLVDPAEDKKKSAADQSSLTITAIGDKLIITGSDPKMVALAHELALKITSNKGEMYQVFRLKNANAGEAARVLNEWFNPQPQQQQQQRNQNPFQQLFQGRLGGAQQPAANPEETKPRVRIVAEQTSNSLLVRANMLDLITIKNLLDSVIDKGAGDSNAVVKPFRFGPLQYAVATEVASLIQQIFSENTSRAASQSTSGG